MIRVNGADPVQWTLPMSERRRIQSRHLLGVTKNHDDDRTKADAHSTGAMLLHCGRDPANSRTWYIEYKCEFCGQLLEMWHADTNDLIREALKDNGLLPK